MTDRKHSSAAFWITVALVVVLVGYPLSFGPAMCLDAFLGQPDLLDNLMGVFYAPAINVMNEAGSPGKLYAAYVNWWEAVGHRLR